MLKGILKYAHHLLEDTIEAGSVAIDATCGNGIDTIFLSNLVGTEGKVLAFDVQKQAIKGTEALLQKDNKKNVTLINDSHEFVSDYMNENEEISGAIFNLGYLPGSDKKIITKGDSTITALQKILKRLKKSGIVVLVVYHGHPGGKEEKNALLTFVTQLSQKEYDVLQYGFINQKNNPPFIIAIEKN